MINIIPKIFTFKLSVGEFERLIPVKSPNNPPRIKLIVWISKGDKEYNCKLFWIRLRLICDWVGKYLKVLKFTKCWGSSYRGAKQSCRYELLMIISLFFLLS
jgi:hypothetical protein